MGFEIVWTETALANLEAILEYIGEASEDNAQRFGAGLVAQVKILEAFPTISPRYPGGTHRNRREVVYKKFRIFYQVLDADKRVTILAIRHGSRRGPINFDEDEGMP